MKTKQTVPAKTNNRQYETVARGKDGGGIFMLSYGVMVRDMTDRMRRSRHRRKQKVTYKGIFKGAKV